MREQNLSVMCLMFMGKEQKCAFEFRMEAALLKRLKVISRRNRVTCGKTVYRAFLYTVAVYRKGLLNQERRSEFLLRENIKDRNRCLITLPDEGRDVLRNLAFTLRKSQAETLRLALECYLYTRRKPSAAEEWFFFFKLWYAKPVYPPAVIVYEAARPVSVLYHLLGPPPSYELTI